MNTEGYRPQIESRLDTEPVSSNISYREVVAEALSNPATENNFSLIKRVKEHAEEIRLNLAARLRSRQTSPENKSAIRGFAAIIEGELTTLDDNGQIRELTDEEFERGYRLFERYHILAERGQLERYKASNVREKERILKNLYEGDQIDGINGMRQEGSGTDQQKGKFKDDLNDAISNGDIDPTSTLKNELRALKDANDEIQNLLGLHSSKERGRSNTVIGKAKRFGIFRNDDSIWLRENVFRSRLDILRLSRTGKARAREALDKYYSVVNVYGEEAIPAHIVYRMREVSRAVSPMFGEEDESDGNDMLVDNRRYMPPGTTPLDRLQNIAGSLGDTQPGRATVRMNDVQDEFDQVIDNAPDDLALQRQLGNRFGNLQRPRWLQEQNRNYTQEQWEAINQDYNNLINTTTELISSDEVILYEDDNNHGEIIRFAREVIKQLKTKNGNSDVTLGQVAQAIEAGMFGYDLIKANDTQTRVINYFRSLFINETTNERAQRLGRSEDDIYALDYINTDYLNNSVVGETDGQKKALDFILKKIALSEEELRNLPPDKRPQRLGRNEFDQLNHDPIWYIYAELAREDDPEYIEQEVVIDFATEIDSEINNLALDKRLKNGESWESRLYANAAEIYSRINRKNSNYRMSIGDLNLLMEKLKAKMVSATGRNAAEIFSDAHNSIERRVGKGGVDPQLKVEDIDFNDENIGKQTQMQLRMIRDIGLGITGNVDAELMTDDQLSQVKDDWLKNLYKEVRKKQEEGLIRIITQEELNNEAPDDLDDETPDEIVVAPDSQTEAEEPIEPESREVITSPENVEDFIQDIDFRPKLEGVNAVDALDIRVKQYIQEYRLLVQRELRISEISSLIEYTKQQIAITNRFAVDDIFSMNETFLELSQRYIRDRSNNNYDSIFPDDISDLDGNEIFLQLVDSSKKGLIEPKNVTTIERAIIGRMAMFTNPTIDLDYAAKSLVINHQENNNTAIQAFLDSGLDRDTLLSKVESLNESYSREAKVQEEQFDLIYDAALSKTRNDPNIVNMNSLITVFNREVAIGINSYRESIRSKRTNETILVKLPELLDPNEYSSTLGSIFADKENLSIGEMSYQEISDALNWIRQYPSIRAYITDNPEKYLEINDEILAQSAELKSTYEKLIRAAYALTKNGEDLSIDTSKVSDDNNEELVIEILKNVTADPSDIDILRTIIDKKLKAQSKDGITVGELAEVYNGLVFSSRNVYERIITPANSIKIQGSNEVVYPKDESDKVINTLKDMAIDPEVSIVSIEKDNVDVNIIDELDNKQVKDLDKYLEFYQKGLEENLEDTDQQRYQRSIEVILKLKELYARAGLIEVKLETPVNKVEAPTEASDIDSEKQEKRTSHLSKINLKERIAAVNDNVQAVAFVQAALGKPYSIMTEAEAIFDSENELSQVLDRRLNEGLGNNQKVEVVRLEDPVTNSSLVIKEMNMSLINNESLFVVKSKNEKGELVTHVIYSSKKKVGEDIKYFTYSPSGYLSGSNQPIPTQLITADEMQLIIDNSQEIIRVSSKQAFRKDFRDIPLPIKDQVAERINRNNNLGILEVSRVVRMAKGATEESTDEYNLSQEIRVSTDQNREGSNPVNLDKVLVDILQPEVIEADSNKKLLLKVDDTIQQGKIAVVKIAQVVKTDDDKKDISVKYSIVLGVSNNTYKLFIPAGKGTAAEIIEISRVDLVNTMVYAKKGTKSQLFAFDKTVDIEQEFSQLESTVDTAADNGDLPEDNETPVQLGPLAETEGGVVPDYDVETTGSSESGEPLQPAKSESVRNESTLEEMISAVTVIAREVGLEGLLTGKTIETKEKAVQIIAALYAKKIHDLGKSDNAERQKKLLEFETKILGTNEIKQLAERKDFAEIRKQIAPITILSELNTIIHETNNGIKKYPIFTNGNITKALKAFESIDNPSGYTQLLIGEFGILSNLYKDRKSYAVKAQLEGEIGALLINVQQLETRQPEVASPVMQTIEKLIPQPLEDSSLPISERITVQRNVNIGAAFVYAHLVKGLDDNELSVGTGVGEYSNIQSDKDSIERIDGIRNIRVEKLEEPTIENVNQRLKWRNSVVIPGEDGEYIMITSSFKKKDSEDIAYNVYSTKGFGEGSDKRAIKQMSQNDIEELIKDKESIYAARYPEDKNRNRQFPRIPFIYSTFVENDYKLKAVDVVDVALQIKGEGQSYSEVLTRFTDTKLKTEEKIKTIVSGDLLTIEEDSNDSKKKRTPVMDAIKQQLNESKGIIFRRAVKGEDEKMRPEYGIIIAKRKEGDIDQFAVYYAQNGSEPARVETLSYSELSRQLFSSQSKHNLITFDTKEEVLSEIIPWNKVSQGIDLDDKVEIPSDQHQLGTNEVTDNSDSNLEDDEIDKTEEENDDDGVATLRRLQDIIDGSSNAETSANTGSSTLNKLRGTTLADLIDEERLAAQNDYERGQIDRQETEEDDESVIEDENSQEFDRRAFMMDVVGKLFEDLKLTVDRKILERILKDRDLTDYQQVAEFLASLNIAVQIESVTKKSKHSFWGSISKGDRIIMPLVQKYGDRGDIRFDTMITTKGEFTGDKRKVQLLRPEFTTDQVRLAKPDKQINQIKDDIPKESFKIIRIGRFNVETVRGKLDELVKIEQSRIELEAAEEVESKKAILEKQTLDLYQTILEPQLKSKDEQGFNALFTFENIQKLLETESEFALNDENVINDSDLIGAIDYGLFGGYLNMFHVITAFNIELAELAETKLDGFITPERSKKIRSKVSEQLETVKGEDKAKYKRILRILDDVDVFYNKLRERLGVPVIEVSSTLSAESPDNTAENSKRKDEILESTLNNYEKIITPKLKNKSSEELDNLLKDTNIISDLIMSDLNVMQDFTDEEISSRDYYGRLSWGSIDGYINPSDIMSQIRNSLIKHLTGLDIPIGIITPEHVRNIRNILISKTFEGEDQSKVKELLQVLDSVDGFYAKLKERLGISILLTSKEESLSSEADIKREEVINYTLDKYTEVINQYLKDRTDAGFNKLINNSNFNIELTGGPDTEIISKYPDITIFGEYTTLAQLQNNYEQLGMTEFLGDRMTEIFPKEERLLTPSRLNEIRDIILSKKDSYSSEVQQKAEKVLRILDQVDKFYLQLKEKLGIETDSNNSDWIKEL